MFTKLLFSQPSSAARAFIAAINESSLPYTYSPSATVASFAETTTSAFSRSCTDIRSPGSRNTCEPPIDAARSLTVTSSSSVILPLSSASAIRSVLMTFVTDAIGRCAVSFSAKSTRPVENSISSSAFASPSGTYSATAGTFIPQNSSATASYGYTDPISAAEAPAGTAIASTHSAAHNILFISIISRHTLCFAAGKYVFIARDYAATDLLRLYRGYKKDRSENAAVFYYTHTAARFKRVTTGCKE